MKVYLKKHPNGMLGPEDESAMKCIAKIKVGDVVSVDLKRTRNYQFLKKYFVLLHYAFDMWTPATRSYKGQVVHKEFEQFRNDIVILAGFYTTSINMNGEVRLRAKSLAFENMEQDEFDAVYQATITVILDRILQNYTHQDLENAVSQIMSFA